jgi:hypothetical protein
VALGWVSKYLKDILSIKLWFYESLNNVALPLNNSMLKTTFFHDLAISIRPPPLCFLLSKAIGCPSCIKTLLIANPFAYI